MGACMRTGRSQRARHAVGPRWHAARVVTDPEDVARRASASAAVEQLAEETTIGLGSGRAVWQVIATIAARWPEGPPLRAVCASNATAAKAHAAGIAPAELQADTRLALAIDGADEVGPQLGLVKGGGGALLREKLVAAAADRFLVVAETAKRVARLGETRPIPVEVVRFGWPATRRRVLELMGDATLRTTASGEPFVTDEGHVLLDCALPAGDDPRAVAGALKAIVGVVEHGLFLDMADSALLGRPDGGVERITA